MNRTTLLFITGIRFIIIGGTSSVLHTNTATGRNRRQQNLPQQHPLLVHQPGLHAICPLGQILNQYRDWDKLQGFLRGNATNGSNNLDWRSTGMIRLQCDLGYLSSIIFQGIVGGTPESPWLCLKLGPCRVFLSISKNYDCDYQLHTLSEVTS